MLKSEKIAQILKERTHSDLANQYFNGMEVQVNVAREDGTRLVKGLPDGGSFAVWTNDDQTQEWKNYRMPYNADTDPVDNDREIRFDHDKYVEGIGLTGWNYKDRQSHFFGFDIDSILGHRKGLTDAQLQDLRKAAYEIPWVTVRRSTSGLGLHLYIHLDKPFPTANHVEHAALARAILSKMSAVTGYHFDPNIDVCGYIMWFWHRKMIGTNGLSLMKEGVQFKSEHIPSNWRDHIDVVSGKSRRTSLRGKNSNGLPDLLREKTSVGLDEQHISIISELDGSSSYWDMDNNVLITHTYMLAEIHKRRELKGYFITESTGKECPFDINCFCFPTPNGGFAVYRFGQGTKEHQSWAQDGKGWTYTYFNRLPDLQTIARAYNAVETEKGWYLFKEAETCHEALKHFGIDFSLPEYMNARNAKVRESRDGRIVVKIDQKIQHDRAVDMNEWEFNKDATYTRIFIAPTKAKGDYVQENIDDQVRHLVSPTGDDMGWVINDVNGNWNLEELQSVKHYLQAKGVPTRDIAPGLGWAVANPWRVVARPFDVEYPGGRDWNRNAPQFSYPMLPPGTPLVHPTWDLVLEHLGQGLNEGVALNEWCLTNHIITGAQYLKLWIASMFQAPQQPTPYLFFFGEQNTGKSIFHEALSMLVTKGYVRADQAMRNPSDFNGELLNAVLCVIEETHLGRDKRAYAHLKDWVTALHLSIHVKGQTPFILPNTTHWCQFANEQDACPVFTGDRRITYVYVPPLHKEIPKKILMARLKEEAQAFLTAMVMKTEIPETNGRLNIPPIVTAEMEEVQRANESALERYLRDNVHQVDGHMILASEFFEKITKWLRVGDPSEAAIWNQSKISREMPLAYSKIFGGRFVRGRSTKHDSHAAYGNLSYDAEAKPNGFFSSDGRFLRLNNPIFVEEDEHEFE